MTQNEPRQDQQDLPAEMQTTQRRKGSRGNPVVEISNISEILAYLKDRKPFLTERFGVTRIGVFGSFAQGRQTGESDIDLVVEFEERKKDIHNYLKLKRLLEKEFARKIDLGFEHCLKPMVRERIKEKVIYV